MKRQTKFIWFYIRTVCVLLAISLSGCATPASTPKPLQATLPLEDCQLTSEGMQTSIEARCGTLTVPEDPANPGEQQITLAVAVIPAVSRNPQPDPLFLIAGGPGQSAIETYPVMVNMAFYNINRDRDLVLLDQRGAGQSNPLECELSEDDDMSEEKVIAAYQACAQTVDADAHLYTTEIAVGDLDQVREALGYDQINLYGASYGTRMSLAYLRRHPDRVRAVILDAVVSPDFYIYANAAVDGAQALDKLFARCQADAACSETFPDLKTEFASLLAQLEQTPVDVEIPDPVSGEPFSFQMTRSRFTNMIFTLLYAPELAALLPLNIHAAYQDGNFAPLIAQASASDAGLYQGLLYAILCTEDIPQITPQQAAEGAETYFGDMLGMASQICEAWPRGQYPADQNTPVTSDVPVLLLSGEADPITPPQYAETVAQTLPNSLHLVAPGLGHGIAIRGCVPRLLANFIETASVANLDADCVQDITPPPFFVSFTGPRP
ncbi:MAG: alpha/beta fold hydrolase [Anaerolineae bacterium]|nr:alpha/beta fold hydrolase [Anaerolineae bacterium]